MNSIPLKFQTKGTSHSSSIATSIEPQFDWNDHIYKVISSSLSKSCHCLYKDYFPTSANELNSYENNHQHRPTFYRPLSSSLPLMDKLNNDNEDIYEKIQENSIKDIKSNRKMSENL